MKKELLSVFLILNFAASTAIFASPVKSIKFEGLKKTKDFVLQKDVEKFIGKEADEETLHEIETVLQKEGFLTDIQLSQNESADGVEITASVKEKITFIPLPIFSVSDGKAMGGLFILDTNAFGLKHNFVIGGYASSSEYSGILMYGRPPHDYFPGITFFASAGKRNLEFVDTDDEDCIDFDMKSGSAGLALTEEFNDYVSLSLAGSFRYADNEIKESGLIDSKYYFNLNPSAKISATDWNGVFMSAKILEFSFEESFYTNGEKWHAFNPRIIFQQPLFSDDLRFIFNGNAIHGKHLPYSAYEGNEKLGVSIFNSDFATSSGMGMSAGLEYAAFKTKIGLFSLYGTYQLARVEDFDDEYKVNQGAGGGVTMYLKQVAIPAMNMGVYYNATKKEFRSCFSIGLSF
ncbi:MAG: POTRA domain-containing protein [Treponema sp.]|nr:hypothetical protein [Spirochaetia bacterium]MDD7459243.1 POTRA domain-containing protein [Spirochaetales bacterium]MDY5811347.1 POTRA domain-containing protein [Treponema sp.]MEE1181710.1 POTRA domain-containing protein [Treponema sp.]